MSREIKLLRPAASFARIPYERRIMGGVSPRLWQTITASVLAGTVIALNASPSTRLGDPFLFFLVPAWLLLISGQIHGFLRKPRSADFAFVIGITYGDRLLIARRYVREMMAHTALSACSISLPFLVVRILLCGFSEIYESGPIAFMVFVELAVSFPVMRYAMQWYFSRPQKHDRFRIPVIGKVKRQDTSSFRDFLARTFMQVSFLGAGLAGISLRPYVRRQILYLIRKDLFSSVMLQSLGVATAALLTATMSLTGPKAVLAVNLFIPVIILIANGATFMESADRLSQCGYYSLSFLDSFKVNVWICGIIFLPYFMGGLTCMSLYHGNDFYSLAAVKGLVSVVLCFAGLAGCFALRFCQAKSDSMGNALLVIAFYCSFMGIMSAVAGSSFPVLGIPAIPCALLIGRLYLTNAAPRRLL